MHVGVGVPPRGNSRPMEDEDGWINVLNSHISEDHFFFFFFLFFSRGAFLGGFLKCFFKGSPGRLSVVHSDN